MQRLGPGVGRRVGSYNLQICLAFGALVTTLHDPERKRALMLRLKRVEGQLRLRREACRPMMWSICWFAFLDFFFVSPTPTP